MQGNAKSQPLKRRWVHLLILPLVSLIILVISPLFEFYAQNPGAGTNQSLDLFENQSFDSPYLISQENTFLAKAEPVLLQPVQKIKVVVTAYSSTPWQTDDTPFITASGSWVKDGIVATNLLDFGTKIRIPAIYGERVFIVEDRMHPRNRYHVDIWFDDYSKAIQFGTKNTYIEVLEG